MPLVVRQKRCAGTGPFGVSWAGSNILTCAAPLSEIWRAGALCLTMHTRPACVAARTKDCPSARFGVESAFPHGAAQTMRRIAKAALLVVMAMAFLETD